MKKIILAEMSALLMLGITVSSCSKSNAPKATNTTTQSATKSALTSVASYSDEDIFKGVIFLDGNVADMLEDFKDYNISALTTDQDLIATYRNTQQDIISQIKAKHPDYLATFRSQITSGDMQTVSAAIADASDLVLATEAETSGKTTEQMRQEAGVVAQNFSETYAVNDNSPKEAVLAAIRQDISSRKSIPTIAYYIQNFIFLVRYIAPGASTVFNTYETERYTTVVALNMSSI